ncbi:MAG: shikimate kinase, partial [Alphaproteobacteria bacterium]|nr:shikimate kinase [Alphaproteobacteria bacterium]
WLKEDIDILVKRLSRSRHRPMLRGVDMRKKLEQLLEMRAPVYAEADITIVTGGQTPQNSARLIKTELDRHAAARSKGNGSVHS